MRSCGSRRRGSSWRVWWRSCRDVLELLACGAGHSGHTPSRGLGPDRAACTGRTAAIWHNDHKPADQAVPAAADRVRAARPGGARAARRFRRAVQQPGAGLGRWFDDADRGGDVPGAGCQPGVVRGARPAGRRRGARAGVGRDRPSAARPPWRGGRRTRAGRHRDRRAVSGRRHRDREVPPPAGSGRARVWARGRRGGPAAGRPVALRAAGRRCNGRRGVLHAGGDQRVVAAAGGDGAGATGGCGTGGAAAGLAVDGGDRGGVPAGLRLGGGLGSLAAVQRSGRTRQRARRRGRGRGCSWWGCSPRCSPPAG